MARKRDAAATTANHVHGAAGVIAGKQVIALDGEENKVRRLARIAEILSGKVFQLNYYIPKRLAKKVGQKHIAVFRRHGFRFDGSNWVMTERGLDHPEVKEIFARWDSYAPIDEESTLEGFQSRNRVRHWKIEYTKGQLAEMREEAIDQLASSLQATHRRLIKGIDKASKTLGKAREALKDDATEKERDKPFNDYCTALREKLKVACERFEMCLRGAEIFDDSGSLDSLFEAARLSIATRAESINLLLKMRAMKQVAVPQSIAPAPTINHGMRMPGNE